VGGRIPAPGEEDFDGESDGTVSPLGRLILREKRRQSFSYSELAARIRRAAAAEGSHSGATQQLVRRWILGQRPRPDHLRWLAIALGLPLDVVVEAAEAHPSPIPLRKNGRRAGGTQLGDSSDAPHGNPERERSVATVHEARQGGFLAQLPPDIIDFTGRIEHVRKMVSLLDRGHGPHSHAVAIMVIAGRGGVGKTALAIHVAHLVKHLYPDGQLYIDLRGAEAQSSDPSAVLAGFLRDLGVDRSDLPERVDERARMYRARLAGQRLLVVLDNASEESQVRPLLPGDPHSAVIVTSRSRLSGLPGTSVFSLETLGPEHAVDLLSSVVGTDRPVADPGALHEIAELCGRLPLALRVAGARLASRPRWSLRWFADQLRDERRRLDMLAAGDLEVRMTFAVSYDGRSHQERLAFRMLGMLNVVSFASWNLACLLGCDELAAEALMEHLVDAELLESTGLDALDYGRYRFHDLTRDFARERLHESENPASQREALHRLAEEYVRRARLAWSSRPAVDGVCEVEVGNGDRAIAGNFELWFAAERPSLVALVEQAHRSELWDETWRLAEPLGDLFEWRADWRDWERTQTLALEAARRVTSARGEAAIARNLGRLYRETGRYQEAIDLLTRSAELLGQIGDDHGEAISRRHLGDTYRYRGQLEDAIRCFGSSVDAFDAHGDRRGVAAALNGMADALRGLCRFQEAGEHFERCIAIYRELGDEREEARSRLRHSMVYRDRCRHTEAETILKDCFEVFSRLNDRRWQGRTLRNLGVIRRNEGRVAEALRYFDDSLRIFDEIADHRAVAVTLRNRGDACRRGGDLDRGEEDLRESQSRFAQLGDRRWVARCRLSMADLLRARGHWADAISEAETALATFREIGDRSFEARTLRELGMVHRDAGHISDAGRLFEAGRTIHGQLGDDLWVARTLASRMRMSELIGKGRGDLQTDLRQVCERAGVADADRDWCLAEW
jgi:tetratricopeptide (TPR) repeat protein/transcriptional regulator with XRE-family HTH domain